MENMKKYVAKFWRSNPQFKAGGYETTRTIEAVSITSARKKGPGDFRALRLRRYGVAEHREGGLRA